MVAAGLRDSVVRYTLNAKLKGQLDGTVGLDLVDCDGGLVARLLQVAEQNNIGNAKSACAELHRTRGVTLYMDPSRLLAWHPSVAPIVTAIAVPSAHRPETFFGYLGDHRAIALPKDGSLKGPILVVLAQPRQEQLRASARERSKHVEIIRPDPKNVPSSGLRPTVIQLPPRSQKR